MFDPLEEEEYEQAIAEAEAPRQTCIECGNHLNEFEEPFGLCDDCAENMEMRS